jgi:RNA polymerase sigma-70 factor (ECF subfamily)
MSPERNFTAWVSRLARAHSEALFRVARREGLALDDALDAVQTGFVTFLSLPRARELVDEDADSRALLTVVVRNAARNARRRHHHARPHEPLDESPAALPSADELVIAAEQHFLLAGCVDRLGELQRRVVVLRMLEELSGRAVASSLDLPPEHVAVLLYRAKAELARCMRE